MTNAALSIHQRAGLALTHQMEANRSIARCAKPCLVDVHTGKIHDLSNQSLTIGRSNSNDLTIEADLSISRRHAQVFAIAGFFYLKDLSSSNGTLCNGIAVEGAIKLRPDDVIHLGCRRFVFSPTKRYEFYQRGETSLSVMALVKYRLRKYIRALKRAVKQAVAAARA